MKIKTSLIRLWRSVYKSIVEGLRKISPEPVKDLKRKFQYWQEKKTIQQNQEILRQILAEKQAGRDYRAIVIFPPGLDWNVQLFQRPQQLALALARQGALVFYVQPEPDHKKEPFELFRERLYLCPVHVGTFQILTNPLIYLLTWNSRYAAEFNHPRLLYDYVDDINAFYGDYRKNLQGHRYLLKNADYILTTARKLYEEVRGERADVIYSPNAVVYEHFVRAARREYPSAPADMEPILAKSQPVIGYYGALARWFDYELLKRVALMRPGYQFVLIGPNYDGTLELAGIVSGGNIHWLGIKPYEELPHYLQYYDVAMIPFMVNDITNATSPLKLFEYMAGEKPVVITPMEESMHYGGVLVGASAEQFAQQLDVALERREDPDYLRLLRETAMENTWEHRAEEILTATEKVKKTLPSQLRHP